MHWSGKLWLGLILVLAPLDAYFALVLIAHRDQWNTRYQRALSTYETQHPQLLTERRRLQDRQYELDRLVNEWGRSWDGVGGGVLNAAEGALVIRAGFAAGLPVENEDGTIPLVYIFEDRGEDGSAYLGEFALVTVEADQAVARLTRPVFGNEVMDWPADGQFRIRHQVPSAHRSLFGSLFAQHAEEQRSLDLQQRLLQRADDQLARSQALLDQRIAELNGDPQPPEGADQDVIDGLVETIRREEVARNADLDTLYALRREYLRKTNRLNELIEGNRQAVAELPGADAAAARPAGPLTLPVVVPADED